MYLIGVCPVLHHRSTATIPFGSGFVLTFMAHPIYSNLFKSCEKPVSGIIQLLQAKKWQGIFEGFSPMTVRHLGLLMSASQSRWCQCHRPTDVSVTDTCDCDCHVSNDVRVKNLLLSAFNSRWCQCSRPTNIGVTCVMLMSMSMSQPKSSQSLSLTRCRVSQPYLISVLKLHSSQGLRLSHLCVKASFISDPLSHSLTHFSYTASLIWVTPPNSSNCNTLTHISYRASFISVIQEHSLTHPTATPSFISVT